MPQDVPVLENLLQRISVIRRLRKPALIYFSELEPRRNNDKVNRRTIDYLNARTRHERHDSLNDSPHKTL